MQTRLTRAAACTAAATLLVAMVAASCGSQKPGPKGPTPGTAAGSGTASAKTASSSAPQGPPKKKVKTTLAAVGLSASALDRNADPCKDFYQFACGGWVKATKIPGDKTRWVRSFSEIHKRNEKDLRAILDAASHPASKKTWLQKKIGGYYKACMDEKRVARTSRRALRKLLRKVRKVRNVKQLAKIIPALHREGIWAFFDVGSGQDFKDATRVIGQLDQGGLGLPDRDYYLKKDKRSTKLREVYQAHVGSMLELAGTRPGTAKRIATAVMRIETALAKVSKTRVQRRDPKGMYNKINRDGVAKLAPALGWKRYFKVLGHPGITEINVTAPKFFSGLQALLGKTTGRDLSGYLQWHVIRRLAPALGKKFVDEAFKMRQALTGQKKQRPRWKRCVASTDHALGELLAQPFIAKRFAGESKASVQRMVRAIGDAFAKTTVELAWMDDATRERARGKKSKMAYLIGYPDKWRKYDFKIGKSYIANLRASRRFEIQRQLRRIGKPVDRKRWEMSPPTVNAYYHPLKNHMVFPAGILQPPFYSAKANLAVNMGGMGMVVGHELTHGFDDKGSLFDAFGNLRAWWTPAVRKSFKGLTSCVAKQYGAYEPLPGLKLNGKLTNGENIADMGGVKLAFRAYRALTSKNKTEKVAEGFGEDQQFFLSVGQIWCAKYRPAYARLAVRVDPHSPPRFRVNGSLANLPEFARAFKCKPGTPMNPKKRCSVW